MSPEFWHRLLSAELSPAKCRDVLRDLGTSPSDPIESLLRSPLLTDTEREVIRRTEMGEFSGLIKAGMHTIEPADYPEPLREAKLVPPVLFALGDSSILHRPTLAIVGTREASIYGKACALKFAEEIAAAGVTIVSGGARGIDGCAHRGALNVGGKTAAVMITGLDRAYPREHAGLFLQIRESGGCLLSQFTAGPKPAHDARPLIRNQTVAALAAAVLVIEAPAQSGSMSTVHAANELGRPIFVVPANIDNVNFRGSHALIRDGATLVDHPYQVLAAMGVQPKEGADSAPSEFSGIQRQILQALGERPLPAEMIVERTGLPTPDVLSELTILELEGVILRDATGFAIRP